MDALGTVTGSTASGLEEHDPRPTLAHNTMASAARPGLAAGSVPVLVRALRLVEALAQHHGATAHHSLRVATILLAMWRLAPELHPDPEEVAAAGLLHDVGKLNLPLGILNGQLGLDAAQRAEVSRHCESGAALLLALGFPRAVLDAARAHHERWDGKGYPNGLAGEEIPVIGRLTAVADSFVAMIEPGRSYRRRRDAAAALEEIERCSGAQFDPAAVRLLLAALGRGDGTEALPPRLRGAEAPRLARVFAALPRAPWE